MGAFGGKAFQFKYMKQDSGKNYYGARVSMGKHTIDLIYSCGKMAIFRDDDPTPHVIDIIKGQVPAGKHMVEFDQTK